FHTIADDLKNAGATWVDEAAVRDGNWVSSRQPNDIPTFNTAMINLFKELAVDRHQTGAKKAEELAFREQLSMEDQE
ncbi:MAG TPA: DJ-1/PfpI family protein, partial [Candidatus Saccharimonadales bacterium]|nr:DJ-1/PfpI family protein [Candidatus Saccharimonadales bacterium]